ncbi:MAG: UDP-3-O-acyl-N-acetylglucosamine deacetylase [Armatimonadota bacterium]
MPNSQTLAAPVEVDGIGIHSGARVCVQVHPAPAGHGRIFVRDGVEIPALAEYVTNTNRNTTLGRYGVVVGTVEHLLAAMMAAQIDDATIMLDGPELPALDGSALPWYDAIMAAGVCDTGGEIPLVRLPTTWWLGDGESQFFLSSANQLILYAAISVPDTVAERMVAGGALDEPEVRQQTLRARTYGLEREVQALLDAGLAQGGSLDNAVILTRDGYLNAHVWPEEPAWHKVQDLLGDLALVGARIHAKILARRAGHRSHLTLVQYLRRTFVTKVQPEHVFAAIR